MCQWVIRIAVLVVPWVKKIWQDFHRWQLLDGHCRLMYNKDFEGRASQSRWDIKDLHNKIMIILKFKLQIHCVI